MNYGIPQFNEQDIEVSQVVIRRATGEASDSKTKMLIDENKGSLVLYLVENASRLLKNPEEAVPHVFKYLGLPNYKLSIRDPCELRAAVRAHF